uniref:Uncharacterized protein n=1 Tax=Arundo donax TaxID=35708 RepID=A0A0A9A6U0_ARUDO
MREEISNAKVRREAMLKCRLEKLEETLHLKWKQRAHVPWLTDGDKNTKFYHAYATAKRRVNHIKKVEEGRWNTGGGRRRFN